MAVTWAHGKIATYTNLKCRCDLCRLAWAQYVQDRKEVRASKPIPADLHGKPTTYSNYRCRCVECREAWRVECADRRERKKVEAALVELVAIDQEIRNEN